MKVSIIIPAYNEEKYIGKCIETLLNQTHRDFEIIIINDGSKDRTVEIVKNLASKNKKIKLLSQNHGGPGRARNLGAQNAKGEILVLVDADMEFDRDYVKKLIKPVEEGREIGAYHIKEYVANKGNIWARCWGTKRVEDKPGMRRPIFRAILKKEFDRAGGFDPATGTFDDQSLAKKLGKEAIGVNAVCYHNNPTTLSETFHHSKWIGGSFIVNSDAMKRHLKRFAIKIILGLVLLALIVFGFLNSWKITLGIFIILILAAIIIKVVREKDARRIYASPVFYCIFIAGFLFGILRQLPNIILRKIKREKVEYKY